MPVLLFIIVIVGHPGCEDKADMEVLLEIPVRLCTFGFSDRSVRKFGLPCRDRGTVEKIMYLFLSLFDLHAAASPLLPPYPQKA